MTRFVVRAVTCGLLVVGLGWTLADGAIARSSLHRPVVLRARFAAVAGAGRLIGSARYAFIGDATGLTYVSVQSGAGELIDNRTGVTRHIASSDPSHCEAAMFGGPWLLFSCETPPVPYSLDQLDGLSGELYSPTAGTDLGVPAAARIGSCNLDANSCPFIAAAVGTRWLEIVTPGAHAPTEYWFQNLKTGALMSDPTTATRYANLNSPTLLQRLCRPLRLPLWPLGGEDNLLAYATLPGELTSYGKFVVIADPHAGARLQRCGTRLDMPLGRLGLPDPTGSYANAQPLTTGPNITGNTHLIVWQSATARLSGLFLPSLRRFEIRLPAKIAPPTPSSSEFTLAISPRELYLATTTGIWSTGTPTQPSH